MKATYLVHVVDFVSPNATHWKLLGSVSIEPHSDRATIEHALRRFEIYAPRGADTCEWSKNGKTATIREYGTSPAVRLTRRDS